MLVPNIFGFPAYYIDSRRQAMDNKAKSSTAREVFSWIKTIALALAIALVIRTFVFEPMKVPTGSMISTIDIGDVIFVNKFIYRFTPVKRGDIVAFWYPDSPNIRYVKRVIGVGGDVVEIKGGKLYLNGGEQTEPYIREPMLNQNFGPYKVPPGEYFMMGDNRNDSKDSRYWNNKYVTRDKIIGKMAFRFWPLSRIGAVK